MRSLSLWRLVPVVALLVAAVPGRAAEAPTEPLVEKVRKAIDDGVAFLKSKQRGDGGWEHGLSDQLLFPGGMSGLAMLALLNSGVPPNDPAIQKGLTYLRTYKLGDDSKTYTVSLQTMVYCQAGQAVDRKAIEDNVAWLLQGRSKNGWGYFKGDPTPDNSNTQYALLALHEALQAGIPIDKEAIKAIQDAYLRGQQQRDGGWIYRPGLPTSMTMTAAGLCGLVITGMDLDVAKVRLDDKGVDPNCGKYEENKPVAKALDYIGNHFHPSELQDVRAAASKFKSPFYCFYGLERAGRLTGRRYFGGHDWYRVGCDCLTAKGSQKADGSWGGAIEDGELDSWPVVATSFSLLFLSKGRTPVLLTKLAYGDGDGWNTKHNDARHLVEFVSKELFKKQPLAWQAFDVRDKGVVGKDQVRELTQELLESPIVYIIGHDQAPRDREELILKEYVENGGFIFAEACCGGHPGDRGEDFDKDIHEFARRVWPDAKLEPLKAGHPVWTASGKFVSLPSDFELEGVESGCKTVMIYSRKPLAGYWEANQTDTEKGKKAFQMAANIIAYATGLEKPRNRLDEQTIAGPEDPTKIKRGYLKVAQLKHEGDWQPARKAMPNLMGEVHKVGIDVAFEPKEIALSAKNLADFRFLYMHGRREFSAKPEELAPLRFTLEEAGGLLFADACCGSREFDASFRKMTEALWKDHKLEPIPLDDELFGAELNGTKIEKVRCRRRGADGERVSPEYQDATPALEGIKINGRWVVIYSRYDIGCALEGPPSSDCLGHDHESAVRLGKAAVLYALHR